MIGMQLPSPTRRHSSRKYSAGISSAGQAEYQYYAP